MNEILEGRHAWKQRWKELGGLGRGRVEDAVRQGQRVEDESLRSLAGGKARREFRHLLWTLAVFVPAIVAWILFAAATGRDWWLLLPAFALPFLILPIHLVRCRRAMAANAPTDATAMQ